MFQVVTSMNIQKGIGTHCIMFMLVPIMEIIHLLAAVPH